MRFRDSTRLDGLTHFPNFQTTLANFSTNPTLNPSILHVTLTFSVTLTPYIDVNETLNPFVMPRSLVVLTWINILKRTSSSHVAAATVTLLSKTWLRVPTVMSFVIRA